jgi:DNA-binding NarL/FixJ family response regulator
MCERLPVRVFLAEDSAIIRQRLSESISDAGRIEVIGYADTERDTVDALRETACDAVVLDLQLKQGNGLAALKSVRASEVPRQPVVIVLTNYAFPHYRARSMQLGADYFFDKAREYDSVRDVLEELVREREAAGGAEGCRGAAPS